MSFLDRLRKRQLPPSTTRRKVRDEPGPLTCHEAWAVARPAAHALDPDARLTLVTSGLDMRHDGRSFSWEFLFDLPKRGARLLLSLEPSPDAGGVDDAPIVLVQRVSAAAPAESSRAPALPERFRDSPEAVEELSAGGVDFVAGPSDMKLEGRVLGTGEAVWVTYYWDDERRVAFGAAEY